MKGVKKLKSSELDVKWFEFIKKWQKMSKNGKK